jgi:putative membrane protein
MNKFLIKLAVNAFAFFVAVTILRGNGIDPQNIQWWGYLVLALIFGVINAVLRPILTILGCPFIILTLGLGFLLINTLLFYLTGLIGTQFGIGFIVDGIWPAFLGALIVSVIGVFFSIFLKDVQKDK